MFQNRVLDFFTRVHPVVPPLIFGPAIVILFIGAFDRLSIAGALGLAVAGYVWWTLFEYWLHRLVFHFEPEKGLGARLHWMIHGVHHDHPNDPLRLVMPPSVSVPLALLLFWLYTVVFGFGAGLAFTAGFLAGYLAYDMLHYHVHHHQPRSALGQRLRELHMRHHFQDADRGFGISAPYWDRVFGTLPRATGNRGLDHPQQDASQAR
jgi:sterol desaturase/sphingolipid hydroxylase (fatty acid hydroxylase superfamily)